MPKFNCATDSRGAGLAGLRPLQKWNAVVLPHEHCSDDHLQAIKQAMESGLEVNRPRLSRCILARPGGIAAANSEWRTAPAEKAESRHVPF